MSKEEKYLFTLERLGFRNWTDKDLEPLSAINQDPEVMAFFPSVRTTSETAAFINRMREGYRQRGFCFFAVERLDNLELLGFTGLSVPAFEADFMPCVEIGWRLKRNGWDKGYAVEGALACLQHGFTTFGLREIVAISPLENKRSISVMEKTGMKLVKVFNHPLLKEHPRLERCALYSISISEWKQNQKPVETK